MCPASGRYAVYAKSPLTGVWGESHSGGHFGPELKFSRFDGIIFEGRSEKPVYLLIDDGKPELRSAEDLWGKDKHETEEMIFSYRSETKKSAECAVKQPSHSSGPSN